MMTAWAHGLTFAAPVGRARSRPALAGQIRGPTASALAVKRKRYESGLHLIVAGELDSVTAPALTQQYERVDSEETGTVLLDLADVTFIDRSGLDLLTAAYARFRERLVIIVGQPCAHAIDVANARDRLPIIEG